MYYLPVLPDEVGQVTRLVKWEKSCHSVAILLSIANLSRACGGSRGKGVEARESEFAHSCGQTHTQSERVG